MSRWVWAVCALGAAVAGIAWLEHALHKLRRDLTPHGELPTKWLEERMRNRR